MENKTISVELSEEQYAFLTNWQKKHETELGIEVPLSAMVRKAVDGAMKNQKSEGGRDSSDRRGDNFERKPRSDSRGGDRPSFGDRPRTSGRDGDRPSFGGSRGGFRPASRGPKFGGFNDKRNTVRKFDK